MPPSWLSLVDEEEIVWSAHPSWYVHVKRAFLGLVAVVLGFAVASSGVLASVQLGSTSLGAVLGFILALLGVGLVLFESLRRLSTSYVLTTRHVYKKVGLLSRNVDPIRLDRVADMEYSQSIAERMVGVGDVRIMTAGTGGKDMVLEAVPSVRAFTDEFSRAVDRHGSSGAEMHGRSA